MSSEAKRRNPYPGPRPFMPDERALFFGREHESRDLFALVVASRTVLMYAQSGAGKTSLLNAGLVPALLAERFDVLPIARPGGGGPRGIAPPDISNIFVFAALSSWAPEPGGRPELCRETFAKFLQKRPATGDASDQPEARVLLFDQFEEIFTAHVERRSERTEFFNQLAEALVGDRRLRIVFVIREDFLAHLDAYTALLPGRLRSRMRLERLGAETALQAIKDPLRGTGVSFAEGVAEQLVQDLLKERIQTAEGQVVEIPGDYVEPVQLQVVCSALWHPDNRLITAEHLSSVGSIDQALSKFYDDAVEAAAQLADGEESAIRDWCENELITPMGTRGTVYRGAEATKGIPNAAVDVLEQKHLIRAEWRAGARWYELTHDRFIEPVRSSNRDFLRRVQAAAEKAQVAWVRAADWWDHDHPEDALGEIEQVLTNTQPGSWSHVVGLQAKGDLLRELGRNPEALVCLEKAAKKLIGLGDPQRAAMAWRSIAAIHHDLEEDAESALAYGRALNLETEPKARGEILLSRASSYWYAGSHADAVADYNHAAAALGETFDILMARGQALAEMGEAELAIRDLEKALKQKVTDATAIAYTRSGLALAYSGVGRYREALREFRLSIAGEPDNAWVYFNQAICNERLGKYDRARTDYETALAKDKPKLNAWKRAAARAKLESLSTGLETV